MDVERIARATKPIARKTSVSAATHGIDEVMKANTLDALLFPGASGAALAARPGYPDRDRAVRRVLRRPRRRRTAAFPPGSIAKPPPFGVSFTGMACSEPTLIALAYAFEQATKKRAAPPGLR